MASEDAFLALLTDTMDNLLQQAHMEEAVGLARLETGLWHPPAEVVERWKQKLAALYEQPVGTPTTGSESSQS